MDFSEILQPQNASWSTWRQSASNTGQSIHVGPNTAIPSWVFITNGRVENSYSQGFSAGITSTPVVGNDGRVYFSANDGNLYCVDRNGKNIWSNPLHFPGMAGIVVRNDNSVVVTTNYKLVYAVGSTGKTLWMTVLNSHIHSAPMIHKDGTIYVGTDGNDFNAIDGNTGAIKWTTSLTDQNISFVGAAAIGKDGNIYVGASQLLNTKSGTSLGYGYLLGLEPINGAIVYQKYFPEYVTASPVISESNVIYVTHGNNVEAIFMGNKTTWWSKQYGDSKSEFWSTMAISSVKNGATLYVPSLDGNLYAISDDGKLIWSFKTGNSIDSSPAIDANENIYVSSNDGNMYAINKVGQELFKYKTNNIDPYVYEKGFTYFSSSPVIASGALYVGSSDGTFHALATSAGGNVPPPPTPPVVNPDPASSPALSSTQIAVGAAVGFVVLIALVVLVLKYCFGVVFFRRQKDRKGQQSQLERQQSKIEEGFTLVDQESARYQDSSRSCESIENFRPSSTKALLPQQQQQQQQQQVRSVAYSKESTDSSLHSRQASKVSLRSSPSGKSSVVSDYSPNGSPNSNISLKQRSTSFASVSSTGSSTYGVSTTQSIIMQKEKRSFRKTPPSGTSVGNANATGDLSIQDVRFSYENPSQVNPRSTNPSVMVSDDKDEFSVLPNLAPLNSKSTANNDDKAPPRHPILNKKIEKVRLY